MSCTDSKRNREDGSLRSSSSDSEPPTNKPLVTVQALQDMVKVKVGKDDNKLEVLIPTTLLVSESEFFKSACSARWECGRNREIDLSEENPDAFSVFVFWLFNGKVEGVDQLPDIHQDRIEESEEESDDRKLRFEDRQDILSQCFILGDMLQSANFCNTIMDELVTLSKIFCYDYGLGLGCDKSAIELIFKNTTTDSPLRMFLFDLLTACVCWEDFEYGHDLDDTTLYEFLKGLAHSALQSAQKSTAAEAPWTKSKCTYHKHPDKPDGYSCD